LAASKTHRAGILVRMPTPLKGALVRETARRGSNVNDVAAGILAEEFGVAYTPSGRRRKVLAGSSPVLLLRVPQELKDEIQAEASRSGAHANDIILAALADGLGIPSQPQDAERKRKELMAGTNGSKNGRRSKDKVRVAIVGVGNCANSLLQGVEYYKNATPEDTVPGLMHVDLGGYHISDIEFTAAFDVVKGKVGVDLADAIWAHPNDTIKFANVPKTGIKVSRGMTHDGIGKYLSQVVEKAPGQTDDVVGILKETGTDVVVNYLPVGSEEATKWYTEQILTAGVAMVNCMPVFIAREAYWQKRFEDAGVPIIGDDIKSQVGATITHRVLTTLFGDRGVHLDKTMQLNVGGNSDFRNMLERERLESKKISKTNAVTSMLDYDIGEDNIHVGPSDYVPWLTDRKWAYIRMEGSSFGDVPLNVELKLEVWDSPNSAGIVIDAVRLAKLALNNGIAGALEAPSAYLMKSPPKQIRDDEAHDQIERFIVKNAVSKQKAAAKA
jgi:myo-inositol-1-phosphate synthase